MIALSLVLLVLLPMTAIGVEQKDAPPPVKSKYDQYKAVFSWGNLLPLSTSEEGLALMELPYRPLWAVSAERGKARENVLQALGAWKPTVQDFTLVGRYHSDDLSAYARNQVGVEWRS